MSAEENKAHVHRFFEEMLNQGDTSVGDELFAVDALDHAAFPGQVAGREGFKQVTVTGINILRFADGQIVECWEVWDRLGLLQQLGVLPAPGEAPK